MLSYFSKNDTTFYKVLSVTTGPVDTVGLFKHYNSVQTLLSPVDTMTQMIRSECVPPQRGRCLQVPAVGVGVGVTDPPGQGLVISGCPGVAPLCLT